MTFRDRFPEWETHSNDLIELKLWIRVNGFQGLIPSVGNASKWLV